MAFFFHRSERRTWRPQSLRVEWGNTIRQRTKDRYFYTHEEANLGIQWGRLNISLAGGGSALFRDFDSSLEGLPDSLGTMINALTTNYQSLQLTPKLEYKRKRWEGKTGSPTPILPLFFRPCSDKQTCLSVLPFCLFSLAHHAEALPLPPRRAVHRSMRSSFTLQRSCDDRLSYFIPRTE